MRASLPKSSWIIKETVNGQQAIAFSEEAPTYLSLSIYTTLICSTVME